MAKLGRNRSGHLAGGNAAENGPLSRFLRFAVQSLLCIAALTLGFRLSREALFILVSFSASEGAAFSSKLIIQDRIHHEKASADGNDIALRFPYIKDDIGNDPKPLLVRPPPKERLHTSSGKSSRVNVGRHEILIREWPHPHPVQMAVAHQLIELVQHEQRLNYGIKDGKQFLVVTPTYVRTFQGLHLTSLIHTLRVVPSHVIWIVVEAGGVTNETAALLSSSQISYYHLGVKEAMPAAWEERRRLEVQLRVEGLRFIREHQLDGLVVFADDSNTYSLDFFEEAQKVKWIGAFSVGLLYSAGMQMYSREDSEHKEGFPVQGPACNSTGHLIGWYVSKDYMSAFARGGLTPLQSLEWAGFVINARLLWESSEKPEGIRSWNELFDGSGASIETPLDLVQGTRLLEPHGNCGRSVLLWWLRIEARADSKFPSRWLINPGLEIVVPWKKTPWPEPPKRWPPPPLVGDTAREKHGNKQGGRGREKRKAHRVEKSTLDLKHAKGDGGSVSGLQ